MPIKVVGIHDYAIVQREPSPSLSPSREGVDTTDQREPPPGLFFYEQYVERNRRKLKEFLAKVTR